MPRVAKAAPKKQKKAVLVKYVNAQKYASAKPQYMRPFGRAIQGKGGYFGDAWNYFKNRVVPSGTFSKIGGALGGNFGSIGSQIGSLAGQGLSKALGWGAYSLKKNSLMAGRSSTSPQVPFMHSMRDGVRIRHRENLQDISSSTTFTNTVFNINPGLESSFPWLSGIAQNFEEYRFDGLLFEFKSTSAEALNSTNTALGSIIVCAEYNSANASYANKQQMENSMWCVSGKPACDLICPIECSPSMNPLQNHYVRVGSVPANTDQRMYDLCNVQVATTGSQAAAVIGELWITYDVVLLKPILFSALALEQLTAHYQLGSVAVTTAYMGTSQTKKIDTIGLTFTGTTLVFPEGSQGTFLVVYDVVGTSASNSSPTRTYGSNIKEVNLFVGSTGPASDSGMTGTQYVVSFAVNISDPSGTGAANTITWSVGTLPTSASSADIIVTQVNNSLVA